MRRPRASGISGRTRPVRRVFMETDQMAVVANASLELIARDHLDHEIHDAWTANDGWHHDIWDTSPFPQAPASMWAYRGTDSLS